MERSTWNLLVVTRSEHLCDGKQIKTQIAPSFGGNNVQTFNWMEIDSKDLR